MADAFNWLFLFAKGFPLLSNNICIHYNANEREPCFPPHVQGGCSAMSGFALARETVQSLSQVTCRAHEAQKILIFSAVLKFCGSFHPCRKKRDLSL